MSKKSLKRLFMWGPELRVRPDNPDGSWCPGCGTQTAPLLASWGDKGSRKWPCADIWAGGVVALGAAGSGANLSRFSWVRWGSSGWQGEEAHFYSSDNWRGSRQSQCTDWELALRDTTAAWFSEWRLRIRASWMVCLRQRGLMLNLLPSAHLRVASDRDPWWARSVGRSQVWKPRVPWPRLPCRPDTWNHMAEGQQGQCLCFGHPRTCGKQAESFHGSKINWLL